ncbi:hypothetical protein BU17DRAFT_37334 [Hysterangium stoloniferum]|nr:hypothetical protein BU17DRAFT_37334 [Hysterangium stoloniferum]
MEVDGNTSDVTTGSGPAIRLTIPVEYYRLPLAMTVSGGVIGMFRGGRKESLRYLAENAHRAPKTLQGWYFYKKTKNYRVILGGLRGAGADGTRLGLTAVGWVGLEEGMRRTGLDEVREIGAGIGTGGLFAVIYRLPWIATRQAVFLGFLTGLTMRAMRFALDNMRREAERQTRRPQVEQKQE